MGIVYHSPYIQASNSFIVFIRICSFTDFISIIQIDSFYFLVIFTLLLNFIFSLSINPKFLIQGGKEYGTYYYSHSFIFHLETFQKEKTKCRRKFRCTAICNKRKTSQAIYGELFPSNLPCAWHLAATLLEAGDQRSALLVDELQAMDEIGIGKVKTSEEAVEIYRREAQKGNTFAMVRLAASLSLTSTTQAKALVEQAANAGNLRAQYALGKQLDLTVPFSKLKVLYLTERLARISAEEKELNLLDEEMKKANVLSSTETQVDWLLSKAQWPAATAYQEPASLPEQKEAFMKARALEQKGNNFKKVVKLYKPVAEAGDVEAMRRLGNILINFRSSYTGDAAYLEGREWLKKAAASSVLAQYHLGITGTS